jgi:hypothetical protein
MRLDSIKMHGATVKITVLCSSFVSLVRAAHMYSKDVIALHKWQLSQIVLIVYIFHNGEMKRGPLIMHSSRSQCPCSLRRNSEAAVLLRSRVHIPLREWMFVSCAGCESCR